MRSTEKRGATIEEATAAALAELDVTIDDAEVEVVSTPRRGLFGGSRKAVVRVTVRPEATRSTASVGASDEGAPDAVVPPDESAEGTHDAGSTAERPREHIEDHEEDSEETVVSDTAEASTEESVDEVTPEQQLAFLDEECELAADFVEGLLDLLDLPGDIEIEVSEETAVVNVSDVGSGLLIGRRGATLDALQELVRSSTQRQTERRSHVRVDVEGYRARHLDKLRTQCRDAIAQVRETGESHRLEPMDAYERKMMHDLVSRTGGVTSSSEGAEPKRRVIILPE